MKKKEERKKEKILLRDCWLMLTMFGSVFDLQLFRTHYGIRLLNKLRRRFGQKREEHSHRYGCVCVFACVFKKEMVFSSSHYFFFSFFILSSSSSCLFIYFFFLVSILAFREVFQLVVVFSFCFIRNRSRWTNKRLKLYSRICITNCF